MSLNKSREFLILEAIRKQGTQTVRDMLDYAGNNPSQYINSVLRRHGWDLPDEWQTNRKGQRYKVYRLSKRDTERFDALVRQGKEVA